MGEADQRKEVPLAKAELIDNLQCGVLLMGLESSESFVESSPQYRVKNGRGLNKGRREADEREREINAGIHWNWTQLGVKFQITPNFYEPVLIGNAGSERRRSQGDLPL